MATNNWNITTDDYDIYGTDGVPSALQGSPYINENGELERETNFFPMSTLQQSTMDQDPNNTGPTNDFWSDYPISIDINGYIFYNGNNTGINVRGPAGLSEVRWEDLTPEQIAALKGEDGANGLDGADGQNGLNGADGLDAYHVWLRDNGWLDDPEDHPISDFYAYIGGLSNLLLAEGTGNGSLILNYRGTANIASGEGALATGKQTKAAGAYSFTAGLGTTASQTCMAAFGSYNKNTSGNIFEIGNGTTAVHSNALELTQSGTLKVQSDVIVGAHNLTNKVDKENGKQLSTNDFTNHYKDFIDNYTVDVALNAGSENPVANAAVTNAINTISSNTGKPLLAQTSSNNDLPLLFPHTSSDPALYQADWSNSITWNPARKNLQVVGTSPIATTYTYFNSLGENLIINNSHQTVIGKYNAPSSSAIFQVGYGENNNSRENILNLSNNGDFSVAGNISDGNGNVLSQKQNILQWDTEPTNQSEGVVNSGNMYNYLNTHVSIPLTNMSTTVSNLQNSMVNFQLSVNSQIAAITSQVNALLTKISLTDETTGDEYNLGVNNGTLYLEPVEEEEE